MILLGIQPVRAHQQLLLYFKVDASGIAIKFPSMLAPMMLSHQHRVRAVQN